MSDTGQLDQTEELIGEPIIEGGEQCYVCGDYTFGLGDIGNEQIEWLCRQHFYENLWGNNEWFKLIRLIGMSEDE